MVVRQAEDEQRFLRLVQTPESVRKARVAVLDELLGLPSVPWR